MISSVLLFKAKGPKRAEYAATVRKKAMFTDPEDAKFVREFSVGSKITTNRTIDLGWGPPKTIYTVWEIEPRGGLKRKPKDPAP